MNEQATAGTEAAYEVLRIRESLKPKIKESEFYTKYLLTLHRYCTGEPTNVTLWTGPMDITPFGEVDVVNTEGEVLFTVPSILVNNGEVLPASVAGRVPDILATAENIEVGIPGAGRATIRKNIIAHVQEQPDVALWRKRWDAIFTRYNLPSPFNTPDAETTEGGSSAGDEFDDYEES